MFSFLMEVLVLVLALSVDTFVACFAYGAEKVKIPWTSALVLSGISTGLLLLSLGAGGLLGKLLPAHVTRGVCFIILLSLGLVKLFDGSVKAFLRRGQKFDRQLHFSVSGLRFILTVYADPEEANQEDVTVLSAKEAVSLGAALSLDSAAAGLGAGAAGMQFAVTAVCAFEIGLLAVLAGCMLGNRLADRVRFSVSWVGGVLLILLAFLKFF